MVAAGGSLALGGLFVVLAAIVLALAALGMDPSLAALIVGAGTLAVGYLIVRAGLARVTRTSIVPAAHREHQGGCEMGDRPEGVNDVEAGTSAPTFSRRAMSSQRLSKPFRNARPRNLVAQAGETVKEATVGKVKEMATSAGEKMSEAASQTRGGRRGGECMLESGWFSESAKTPCLRSSRRSAWHGWRLPRPVQR